MLSRQYRLRNSDFFVKVNIRNMNTDDSVIDSDSITFANYTLNSDCSITIELQEGKESETLKGLRNFISDVIKEYDEKKDI